MNDFFRFPHTAHLLWLGKDPPRDDKVLSQHSMHAFFSEGVIVEEKIDGANIGISVDSGGDLRVQNRGRYLETPFRGQFSRLESWLAQNESALQDILDRNTILFGEWCAAVHSIIYSKLPDWVLFFDVYDRRKRKFWSVHRRNSLVLGAGLTVVPEIVRGRISSSELFRVLSDQPSQFSESFMEGVIVRKDSEEWCVARAKLVRTEFVQAIGEHWQRGGLRWNRTTSA